MPFSRLFCRQVGFGLLMFNADKDASGGGKAKTIPELTQRVTTLEGENQTLTTQLADANTAKTDLQTKLTAEEQKVKDVQTKLTAEEQKVKDVQTKLTAEEQKVKDAEKLLADAKQETQVAQTKANETAAKAGMKAPFTTVTQEAGKKQGGDENAGKTSREKLASFCKVAGE